MTALLFMLEEARDAIRRLVAEGWSSASEQRATRIADEIDAVLSDDRFLRSSAVDDRELALVLALLSDRTVARYLSFLPASGDQSGDQTSDPEAA